MMMITVLSSKPFQSKLDNATESINEIVIITICYHLIIVSEFVPPYEGQVKKINEYIMIAIISLTAIIYIIIIVASHLYQLIYHIKSLIM